MTIEKWQIDNSHSSVGFSVRHMVIAKVHGQFRSWTADLELDLQNLAASKVDVSVDVASIDTREEKRDGHLRSADFFDAEHHPKMTFKTSRVEVLSPESLKLHGQLSIRGTTHDVALDVDFNGRGKDPWGGERVAFSAKTRINRQDYGLKWNQVLEAGGLLVAENVDIQIEIEAKKV